MALRRRRFLRALGTTVPTAGVTLVGADREGEDESDPTWTVTLGDGDYQIQTVVGAPNGDAVLVGRTGSSNDDEVWVAAVAPDGERRWERTLDADGVPRTDGADAADGGFALAGTMGDAGRRPWLVRTDGTGEERWRREYEFEATPLGVESLPDGGYLVYGFGGDPRRVDGRASAWAMRTDDAGEPLWRRAYEGTVAADALAGEDGYALAGRYSASEDDSDAWLAVLEEDGELRRSHAFGGVGDDGVAALLPRGTWLRSRRRHRLPRGRRRRTARPDRRRRPRRLATHSRSQRVRRRPRRVGRVRPRGRADQHRKRSRTGEAADGRRRVGSRARTPDGHGRYR